MLAWSAYAEKYGHMEAMPGDYPKLAPPLVRAIQEMLLSGKDPKAALDTAPTRYNALHP